MKIIKMSILTALFLSFNAVSFAVNPVITSIQDYNQTLPLWGTSWKAGSGAMNGYYPSFYTGFAMRSQFPERIHVRTARGNQTRLTVVLDEQTIKDYLFDLTKRYSFYRRMTAVPGAPLNLAPASAQFIPQLASFNQIIETPTYGILPFVQNAAAGGQTAEAVYSKSLNVLSQLNPGRIFFIRLDLNNEFSKWKAQVQAASAGNSAKILGDSTAVISAINTLVFGRINYTEKPTAEVLSKLKTAIDAAINNAPAEEFTAASLNLFKAVTGKKYAIKVVNSNGQFQDAIQCSSTSCVLGYPEFTAIYPTGSAISFTNDDFGNKITSFATPGLWQFLSRSYHEIDNIRKEPYYGYVPKMDYEGAGNGFHNPAVRFYGPSSAVKKTLGVEATHNTLWAVKRGGVSHGCLRMPSGHVWEMRHIFPVENSKATKVMFFGSRSKDFDLFDIDGNGQPEVMGVEYFISYGLSGADGLASREGAGLEINADKKLDFYTTLYGSRNVFTVVNGTQFVFQNPRVSMPSYLDFKKKTVKAVQSLTGNFPLYEQTYEKDKIQLYAIGDMASKRNKDIVRLMGRIRGCAPTSDKQQCGEVAFDNEMRGLGL